MLGKYFRNEGYIVKMTGHNEAILLRNGEKIWLDQEENEPLPIDYDTLLSLGFDASYEDNYCIINGVLYSLSYLEQFETIDKLQDKINF